ncbi:MAG: DUF3656 domain-containing U32 family peptidase [Bacillota bacterium]
MKEPELLAPAGSMEALVAAANSGADAVYLGGRQFSARQSAANFDEREIEEAIAFSHRRGVKVYVAVNTLLGNHEMEAALKYLSFLQRIGADAVIVQDIGLIHAARQLLPHLELHASTQMTTHNADGAKFLERQGLDRVVLARELSLEQIKEIGARSSIGLEMFIHGALCICYSGQCLMSSFIGGRSGNRGRCAQPCRLPYSLVERDTGEHASDNLHLLSTKDLCLIEQLPEIISAGVMSFKIEGRMKRPEYVATVVRIYREAIDRFWTDPENYLVTEAEKKDLAQIFNRDFTTGYLYGNPGKELMGYARPNNRGIFLGRIVATDNLGWARVKLSENLSLGDGIEVWVSKGGRIGFTVEAISMDRKRIEGATAGETVEIKIPEGVRVGDRLFKTYDVRLMAQAHEVIGVPGAEGKIPVTASVRISEGEPLIVIIKDRDGFVGEGRSDFRAEVALKRPITLEVLKEQLSRLGNTPFILEKVEAEINGSLMVPLSEINAIRRMAVENLLENRKKGSSSVVISSNQYSKLVDNLLGAVRQDNKPNKKQKARLSVLVGDYASALAAVSAGADQIFVGREVFRGNRLSPREIERLVSLGREKDCRLILATPRIWTDEQRDDVLHIAQLAVEAGTAGVLAGNLGTIELINSNGLDIPLFADFSLNLFNDLACTFLSLQGFSQLTLSPELNFNQISQMRSLHRINLECIVHGNFPLMVSEHCVLGAVRGGRCAGVGPAGFCSTGRYGLMDRMKFVFPIETDQYCRMHLYNSKDLCLVEHLSDLLELGIDCIRIEAGNQDAVYVNGTVRLYREALDMAWEGLKDERFFAHIKERLAKFSPEGFTKGHYFRGVL